MNAQSSKIYNEERANMTASNIDIEYVVQIKFMTKEAACMTHMELEGLGYETEVIKMVVWMASLISNSCWIDAIKPVHLKRPMINSSINWRIIGKGNIFEGIEAKE